jgi:glutamate N-acetyltransferase/amino-acid N-acetyltransferase
LPAPRGALLDLDIRRMAASAPISPLAPKNFPALPPIEGVRFAAGAAGVRYQGRTDVMVALFDRPARVAGVFTRSKCPSAPVDWCRAALAEGQASALVVNSGNANAFTGAAGVATTTAVAKETAKAIGATPNTIFQASTGVIGEPMDPAPIVKALPGLLAAASPDGLMDAARAIMTTDTFPKVATARAKLGDAEVTINGIAKGAGMIAPDMATMLSFVFTDAPIAARALQALLRKSVGHSFNAITVDSDTSTSDTLLMFATGAAAAHGAPEIADDADPRLGSFRRALDKLLIDLAQQVARDGEGARKFIEVRVAGAATRRAAKRIAFAIANSPLVKTAVAGEDANWGRVVMAVGKAGEKAERDKLDIFFGDLRVAHAGLRDPDYSEAEASAYMKKKKIVIGVHVGVGTATAKVWTCDLTKEYVAINGDYRS